MRIHREQTCERICMGGFPTSGARERTPLMPGRSRRSLQHLLICEGCAQQLALMRRQELEQIALQGALRTHALVYAMALAVLLVLNAFLVVMVPTPVLRSCGVVVDKISSAGAGESIEVPDSSMKVCTSVPVPRPLWQTWWVVWVLLVWTPLLGLHLLWEWVGRTIPASRRPAATSLASFISFFL
jgi:hypothetical protein